MAHASLFFFAARGAMMILVMNSIYGGIGLAGGGGLAYGVHRLRQPSAHLYWAELIETSLFTLLVTFLFFLVSLVATMDLWRIGAGCLGMVGIGYCLWHTPMFRHALCAIVVLLRCQLPKRSLALMPKTTL